MRLISSCGNTLDLTKRWRDLVELEKVQSVAKTFFNGQEFFVRYGLRIDPKSGGIAPFSVNHESNEELSFMNFHETGQETFLEPEIPIKVRFILNYRFFYTTDDFSIVSVPSSKPLKLSLIQHVEHKCSFCTGEHSLFQREPLAEVSCIISKRPWQFHWNIAPQDYGGHFLIIPSITKKENRRSQFLCLNDVEDVVDIMHNAEWDTINGEEHKGFIGYNSIGAGATQNHIHFHGYKSPSPLFSHKFSSTEDAFFQCDLLEMFVRSGYHKRDCVCSCVEIQMKKKNPSMISQIVFDFLLFVIEKHHPFNILIGAHSIFIFLRKYNAAQVEPFMGLGVLEYSGTFTYHNPEELDKISADTLCSCLSSALVPLTTLLEIARNFPGRKIPSLFNNI